MAREIKILMALDAEHIHLKLALFDVLINNEHMNVGY